MERASIYPGTLGILEHKKLDYLFSKLRWLELRDATIYLHAHRGNEGPGKGEGVQLTRANLQYAAQTENGEKPNCGLQAELLGQGKLQLTGSCSIAPFRAKMELGMRDLPLPGLVQGLQADWLPWKIESGLLYARGRLSLPEKVWTGRWRIDDFATEKSGFGGLNWKSGSVAGRADWSEKLRIGIESFTVEAPQLNLPGDPASTLTGLLHLLRSSPVVNMDRFQAVNGRFLSGQETLMSGYHPELQNVQIDSQPGHFDAPVSYTLNAEMAGGELLLDGTFGGEKSLQYSLQVTDLLPTLLPSQLVAKLPEVVKTSRLSWQLASGGQNDEEASGELKMEDWRLSSAGPYTLPLALMTGNDKALYFLFDSRPENTASYLLDRFMAYLEKSRVKAALEPALLLPVAVQEELRKARPRFLPGEVSPTPPLSLDVYQKLLEQRPLLRLRLVGSYDQVLDHQALLSILQEADRARKEVELQRRMRDQTGPPAAEIELVKEKRSSVLPTAEVGQVELEGLAGNRAEEVRRYLVDVLQIAAASVVVDPDVRPDGAEVFIVFEAAE
jgi:hypothetical protein